MKPNTDHLDSLLGHRLRQAFLTGQRIFFQTYPEREITPLVYGAMELIGTNPGISHNGICAHLGVAKLVLTTALKPVLSRRYISRGSDKRDARITGYTLTSSGELWFSPIKARIGQAEADLGSNLSDKERKQLMSLLKKVIETT